MITVNAPAKLNVYLHVTGRRDDGYHTLDSLVVFASDIYDVITITPADDFKITLMGRYGAALAGNKHDDNLVVRSARAASALCGKPLKCNITLTKNLPVAAGIGGGSADAAATLRGLLQFWDVQSPPQGLDNVLLTLGADVPVCFYGRAAYMRGIGEDIMPLVGDLPPLYAVLINANMPCPTPQVFNEFGNRYSDAPAPLTPNDLRTAHSFIHAMMRRDNDLYAPARKIAPIMSDVLHVLSNAHTAALTRMSGSGATCFALFTDLDAAQNARDNIAQMHPDWWVHMSILC